MKSFPVERFYQLLDTSWCKLVVLRTRHSTPNLTVFWCFYRYYATLLGTMSYTIRQCMYLHVVYLIFYNKLHRFLAKCRPLSSIIHPMTSNGQASVKYTFQNYFSDRLEIYSVFVYKLGDVTQYPKTINFCDINFCEFGLNS